MGLRQRTSPGNPVGLVFLAASLLVATAVATVPALEPWAGRALWVVAWGLVVYLATALMPIWSESAARRPEPVEEAIPTTAETPRLASGPYPDGLTRREVEVLCLLAAGKANKEIAAQLSLSVPTVERHVANIYVKIGAHGRVEAAAYALGHGLCTPAPRPASL